LVRAYFGETHPTAFERTLVFAGEELVAKSTRLNLYAPNLL